MKLLVLLPALLLLLLNSCGVQIQKRLYRDGFYISTSHHKSSPQTRTVAEQTPLHAAYAETTGANIDGPADSATPAFAQNKVDSSVAFTANSRDELNRPAEKIEALPAPNERYVDDELVKIEKLNKNGKALLSASIIVFPLAFLTLSVALVFSLLALAKIRRLILEENTTPDQEARLAKEKRRARITAWMSGLVLLVLIAGIIIFFSTVVFSLGAGPIQLGL